MKLRAEGPIALDNLTTFSRKRRRRDRSVDVIALSPIGVRAIGDEPFISLH
jgi:hypothetical protein